MGRVIDLDVVEQEKWEAERKHYRLPKSKSLTKKESLDITDFGRKLVELSDGQLSKIDLDETIKQNIIQARNMQKIALKRQMQFIGKMLRKVDNLEEIQIQYDKQTSQNKEANVLLQRLEHIREILVDKEKSAEMLQQIIGEMPELDVQLLRQLIRNHYKEVEKNKPLKSFKQIFQVLKEASSL